MITALRSKSRPRKRNRKSKAIAEASSAPPSAQDKCRKAAALFLDLAFQAITSLASCHQTPSQTTTADLLDEINELARSVTQGDLSRPEKIALTHATVLDVVFTKLTGLAMANFGGPHFDSLMRLAFRAQSQCARTLETLATLKNPAVIAHQLNVAHQQFVAGSGTPGASLPPATDVSLPPAPAALPDSETIVRSAEKMLFHRAHEASLSK
jgi:hypothetical protein